MSKHGGSPESGLAQPAGMDALVPIREGSTILAAPQVLENVAAKERARQFERRRLALEVLREVIERRDLVDASRADEVAGSLAAVVSADVEVSLLYADELMKQTGGFVTGAARE